MKFLSLLTLSLTTVVVLATNHKEKTTQRRHAEIQDGPEPFLHYLPTTAAARGGAAGTPAAVAGNKPGANHRLAAVMNHHHHHHH